MTELTTPTVPRRLIFDKYEVIQRLAVGGMGEVFFAVQRGGVSGFERPVILKSLLPDLAERDDFIDQFLDEARVAATLNHPNVVSIHEVGQWDGMYFIAMEFIRGRNLSQIVKLSVKKKLPIPAAVIAEIIHDAALGLHHAHSAKDADGKDANIVHRDISPQNIMVREDGVTKVVDFGIARANNRASRTATGTVKGKLSYMSPEQLRGKVITGLTDQFALGVVTWELCTRQRLFQADGDLAIIHRVLEHPIPTMSSVEPGIPEELDEIVLKMLDRDPSRRYANCAEVARDLEVFRTKFSPATAESPVARYMLELGLDDLAALTPRATPSRDNFLIDFRSRTGGSRQEDTTKAERGGRDRTAPNTSSRRGIYIGASALLALAFAAVAVWKSTSETLPVEQLGTPAVSAPKVEPKDPPAPVEPEKPARLVITTQPSSANLRVNGGAPQTAPLNWEGAPGTLQLNIDAPGYQSESKQVTLVSGARETLEIVLKRAPVLKTVATKAPIPPAITPTGPGFLTVATTPDTKLWVDDKYVGLTPVARQEFPAGPHNITLRNDEEGILVKRKITLKPGQVFKINEALK